MFSENTGGRGGGVQIDATARAVVMFIIVMTNNQTAQAPTSTIILEIDRKFTAFPKQRSFVVTDLSALPRPKTASCTNCGTFLCQWSAKQQKGGHREAQYFSNQMK